jgi:hypothetical protein
MWGKRLMASGLMSSDVTLSGGKLDKTEQRETKEERKRRRADKSTSDQQPGRFLTALTDQPLARLLQRSFHREKLPVGCVDHLRKRADFRLSCRFSSSRPSTWFIFTFLLSQLFFFIWNHYSDQCSVVLPHYLLVPSFGTFF